MEQPSTSAFDQRCLAAEQAPLNGVRLYTHNTTNAFDQGNDERIEGQFERLQEDNPDVGFLSEAFSCETTDGHLRALLDRFGGLGYKAFAFDYSEIGRPDRHGGIMFMRREMYVAHEVLELGGPEGRRALQVIVKTNSGRRFAMIGAHANDRHEPRVAETDVLRQHYIELRDAGLPVIMLGDFNSDAMSAKRNLLAWVFHAGGRVTSAIKPLARQAAEQEAGQRSTWLGRMASLAIRSYFQLEGDTIKQLLGDGQQKLVSANTEHRPTSYVPKNVPAFMRRALRILHLDRAYIEADYLLADDSSTLTRFMRHERLTDDEHRAISAVLHLGKLAVAA